MFIFASANVLAFEHGVKERVLIGHDVHRDQTQETVELQTKQGTADTAISALSTSYKRSSTIRPARVRGSWQIWAPNPLRSSRFVPAAPYCQRG